MANPFLVGSSHEEIETAIIYEKAKIVDIGKAIAYTDGERLYVNTDDNLAMILPDYNEGMLKWLLWHEKYHMELKHHNRFFKYLKELKEEDLMDEFHVTKDEVNIIMDILVHDSLSKMFPELVETAVNNLAQMRNRNSLGYTFKTYNLEDMLDEWAKHKHGEDKDEGGEGEGEETEETKEGDGEGEGIGEEKSKDKKDKEKDEGDSKKKDKGDGKKKKDDGDKKGHSKGGKTPPKKDSHSHAEDGEPEIKDAERPDAGEAEPESEHDKTDWSKLEDIDTEEFIDKDKADYLDEKINKLRRKKLKMGRLTQKLNGLATMKRDRTYRLPSMLQTGDGCIFKGKTPGRVELYLVFDASGSMSGEMNTFKEIISKSIPQAMDCPCEWFAGYPYSSKIKPYKMEHGDGYYKGKFRDFIPVHASSGYDDDGDRTIELCWLAEQKGFSPIGVTDGGGCISWSKDKLKQLKRTVLVGQNSYWLSRAKEINPSIQILDIDVR